MIDVYMAMANSQLDDAREVAAAFSFLAGGFIFLMGLAALFFF